MKQIRYELTPDASNRHKIYSFCLAGCERLQMCGWHALPSLLLCLLARLPSMASACWGFLLLSWKLHVLCCLTSKTRITQGWSLNNSFIVVIGSISYHWLHRYAAHIFCTPLDGWWQRANGCVSTRLVEAILDADPFDCRQLSTRELISLRGGTIFQYLVWPVRLNQMTVCSEEIPKRSEEHCNYSQKL